MPYSLDLCFKEYILWELENLYICDINKTYTNAIIKYINLNNYLSFESILPSKMFSIFSCIFNVSSLSYSTDKRIVETIMDILAFTIV